MLNGKMGESGSVVVARPRPLAHRLITRISLHVGTKLKRLRTVMARIADENGIPVRALAFGSTALVVLMVAWVLVDSITTDREHDQRITGLENTQQAVIAEIYRRLGVIEQELRDGR